VILAPAALPFSKLVLFVGVNGRWHRQDVVGREGDVGFVTEIDLHEDDALHITATGFLTKRIFDFMGKESGVAHALVSSPGSDDDAAAAAKKAADAFVSFPPPTTDGNLPINLLGIRHHPVKVGEFSETSMKNPGPGTEPSALGDFELQYSITKLA
jgi:hypothetical protein